MRGSMLEQLHQGPCSDALRSEKLQRRIARPIRRCCEHHFFTHRVCNVTESLSVNVRVDLRIPPVPEKSKSQNRMTLNASQASLTEKNHSQNPSVS